MVNANRTDWDSKLHAALWAYRTAYKVTTKHTPFSLVLGTEALLPLSFIYNEENLQPNQEWHPVLKRRMEQLKTIDLTRIEAENNMERTQTMRKRRQDKTLLEGKKCKHCKKPSSDTKEKGEKANHAKEKVNQNKISKFYKGQKVLWHQRMNKPGPGKFRIRWSGPYEIKEIYDNNTVDVNTLQGQPLGRVNMSKIKPYHEPLEANAYVLEVENSTNLSPKESESGTSKCSFQNNNHHIQSSNFSNNQGELRKFCKGQKVVRKYLPYKQEVKMPDEQQRWVGPYTITRIHDDDTIEIETIHQKQLGRWQSKNFLPYDWVNPNQVITFDQDGMKIFTLPDYDEVHHIMLECYFIQPLRIGTCDDAFAKIKSKAPIENYPTQLLPRGNDHDKNMPQSTATTLCDYDKTTTIKDNAHDKYETTKNNLNHQPANMLTTIWLHTMCGKWYLMLMVLSHINWYLLQWISSIHSTNNYLTTEVTKPFKTQINYVNIQVVKTSCQSNFENFQGRKPRAFKLWLKSELKSKLVFIGGVRARRTPRKARTLHEAAFSLVFICTNNTASQKRGTQAEFTNNTSELCHTVTIPPGSHVGIHKVKKSSWDLQQTPRRVTDLPNSIISQTLSRTFRTVFLGLILVNLHSPRLFPQTLRRAFQRALFHSKKLSAQSKNDNTKFQFTKLAELGFVPRSLSSVGNTFQVQQDLSP